MLFERKYTQCNATTERKMNAFEHQNIIGSVWRCFPKSVTLCLDGHCSGRPHVTSHCHSPHIFSCPLPRNRFQSACYANRNIPGIKKNKSYDRPQSYEWELHSTKHDVLQYAKYCCHFIVPLHLHWVDAIWDTEYRRWSIFFLQTSPAFTWTVVMVLLEFITLQDSIAQTRILLSG